MATVQFEDSAVLGGDPFRREGKLQKIHIHYTDELIVGINCEYGGGYFAGERGIHRTDYLGHKYCGWQLQDADITSLHVWWNGTDVPSVAALQFVTSKGTLSEIFGKPNGSLQIVASTDQRSPLIGFRGVYGPSSVTAQLLFNDKRLDHFTSLAPIWSQTRKTNQSQLLIGDNVGGHGGQWFNDLDGIPDLMKRTLKSITIWIGEWSNRKAVLGMKCNFTDGSSTKAWGQTTGEHKTFDLLAYEQIKGIEVRSESLVYAIKFITTRGRNSEWYGNQDYGKQSTFDSPKADLILIGFSGRCACAFDAIGPIWRRVR